MEKTTEYDVYGEVIKKGVGGSESENGITLGLRFWVNVCFVISYKKFGNIFFFHWVAKVDYWNITRMESFLVSLSLTIVEISLNDFRSVSHYKI